MTGAPVHVSEHWLGPDGAELYGTSDMATALDVTPSAVSNYLKRGTGPVPAPAYTRRAPVGDVPLWTAAQVETARRGAIAELEGRLATLERRLATFERTAGAYRRRIARLRGTPLDTGADTASVQVSTSAPR